MKNVEPLQPLSIDTVPHRRTILDHIPIVAGYRTLRAQTSAATRVWLDIKRQLEERSPQVLDLWGGDPEKRQLLEKIFIILQLRFGWTHPRFIPDDPMVGVVASKTGQFEVVEFIMDIEKNILGASPSERKWKQIWEGTFGDFIDFLADQMKTADRLPLGT
jgi:hypothetical protein